MKTESIVLVTISSLFIIDKFITSRQISKSMYNLTINKFGKILIWLIYTICLIKFPIFKIVNSINQYNLYKNGIINWNELAQSLIQTFSLNLFYLFTGMAIYVGIVDNNKQLEKK